MDAGAVAAFMTSFERSAVKAWNISPAQPLGVVQTTEAGRALVKIAANLAEKPSANVIAAEAPRSTAGSCR